MTDRHPMLASLDVLVGRWTVQPRVAGVDAGWTEFSWQEGGAYLRQFTDADRPGDAAPQQWQDNTPFPTTALIGLDDTAEQFTMLYADARGVHRVYQTSLRDGVWRIWRAAPGFHQRFTGVFGVDGAVIDGTWEMSPDGKDWHVDFALTYTREEPAATR